MNTPRILVISNGHGEDLLAAVLIQALLEECTLKVSAYPVVGVGGTYKRVGLEVIGVQQPMPTGGFILKGPGNLVKDLKAGLWSLTMRQMRDLVARRDDFDAVIAVGDIYALWLAGRYVKKPTVFVPTAKSEYISGHYKWEYALMKRYAQAVFPRDEATHVAMQNQGVNSAYVGNLMMDALEMSGETFGLGPHDPVVTMLPGSREDAYLNVDDLLEVVDHIRVIRSDMRFVLSVAPHLDGNAVAKAAADKWQFVPAGDAASDQPAVEVGVIGHLVRRDPKIQVICVRGLFGDVLNVAHVVIGLAGTGNEQAVGLGKPLVAFIGRGTQFTAKFAQDQKRLLGDAMALVDRDPEVVAIETVRILNDEARYRSMAQIGRQRMGPPGGAFRMAQQIKSHFAERGLL